MAYCLATSFFDSVLATSWSFPIWPGDRLTLKAEMLQNGRFIDATDAHTEIFAYIDCYHNTQRLHSSLGYQTPTHFETQIALAN